MTLSETYKTDRSLFSIWQQTQVSFFKMLMSKVQIDFFKAGKIFADLTDSLNHIPSFEEFENEYNK